MTEEKIKVVIDRRRWRTGNPKDDTQGFATGRGGTALVNERQYMCCLGFVCRSAGCDDVYLSGTGEPKEALWDMYDSDKVVGGLIDDLAFLDDGDDFSDAEAYNTELSDLAMEINDNNELHPAEKEKQLLDLFKDTRYELEFTGEYTKTGQKWKEQTQA